MADLAAPEPDEDALNPRAAPGAGEPDAGGEGTEASPVGLGSYIDRVSEQIGATKQATRTVLEVFLECLREDLRAGRWIRLRSIGWFRPVWYRYGSQPIGRGGRWRRIPGRTRTIAFKPVPALRLREMAAGDDDRPEQD